MFLQLTEKNSYKLLSKSVCDHLAVTRLSFCSSQCNISYLNIRCHYIIQCVRIAWVKWYHDVNSDIPHPLSNNFSLGQVSTTKAVLIAGQLQWLAAVGQMDNSATKTNTMRPWPRLVPVRLFLSSRNEINRLLIICVNTLHGKWYVLVAIRYALPEKHPCIH